LMWPALPWLLSRTRWLDAPHLVKGDGQMTTAGWVTILSAFISAVIGGLGVALLNYRLNREKLKAETGKILAETEKIRTEISGLSATVAYSLPNTTERIVFDGRGRIDGFDVMGREGNYWHADGKPASPIGRGAVAFEEGGILNIQRTNTDGRFELWLQRYTFNGRDYPRIPKSDIIAGRRKLRVSCEAKTIGGEHTLRFVIRNPETGQRLSQDVKIISRNAWIPIQAFLQSDPTVETELRIDDENVTSAPSSLQIRNLILVERQS
jgi:hypothetical protein